MNLIRVSCKKGCCVANIDTNDTNCIYVSIHCKNEPNQFTDTERLVWMIENEEFIIKENEGYAINSMVDEYFKTPRDAIDSAIKDSKL